MVTLNGDFYMEGLPRGGEGGIKSAGELSEFIQKIGFLPLFKSGLPGFSVEERTASDSWWSDNPEEDPWEWRGVIAQSGLFAYGKLFSKKAGFVSKEWFPAFAALRREGLCFSERYISGLSSRAEKRITDVLMDYGEMPAFELKSAAGFGGKHGEKGFDTAISNLQMRTYIVINGFQRKISRAGDEFGWPASVYTTPECLWGPDYIQSELSPDEAEEKIISHLSAFFPESTAMTLRKAIK
jgi:hypothetical protein